jgi:superfamily II DNA or RNA helicase
MRVFDKILKVFILLTMNSGELMAAEDALTRVETELRDRESREKQDVQERLSRIVLFQRMIRNIRMNIGTERFGNITLRVNQLRAVSALVEFLKNECNGGDRGYFKQPTGAGKTVLFGIIAKLLDVPTLILVPRQNLLEGTMDELVSQVGFHPGDIGLVGGGDCQLGKKVTIATYQSHVTRMKNDPEYRSCALACELIVCDEAHRSLGDKTAESIDALDARADESEAVDASEIVDADEQEADDSLSDVDVAHEQEVFDSIDTLTNRASLKLAFTATPILASKHVQDAFTHLIAEEKQGELVKVGILVPYRIVQVDGTVRANDIDSYMTEEQESGILARENVYGKLTAAYMDALKAYREKKTEEIDVMPLRGVAFCVNHDECEKFQKKAEQSGLRARIVTAREAKGRKGNEVIKDAERQLLADEIDIIITVAKLGEGWNFKPANAAIWARASTSPMTVIQGIGRTSRSYTDEEGRSKPYSLVFETNWSLRGLERGDRIGKRPLGIADALSLNGEDPKEICSMENGTILHFDKKYEINDEGIVEVDGTQYVDPISYIKALHPRLSNYNVRWLITSLSIRSFDSIWIADDDGRRFVRVTRKGRVVSCQRKDLIDQQLSKILIFPESGVMDVTVMKEGEGKWQECVVLHSYFAAQGLDVNAWKRVLESALDPVKTEQEVWEIRRNRQWSRLEKVSVYLRSVVDKKMKEQASIRDAEAKKIVVDSGEMEDGVLCDFEGGQRRAVYLDSVDFPKRVKAEVQRRIQSGAIQPAPLRFVNAHGRKVIFYWKDEIDAIITEILSAIDEEKKRVADNKRNEKMRQLREKSAARDEVRSRNFSRITPSGDSGEFYVEIHFENRGGIIDKKGDAVILTDYASDAMNGRKLSSNAVEYFERQLSSIPGCITQNESGVDSPLYWKADVDSLIEALKQAAREKRKHE